MALKKMICLPIWPTAIEEFEATHQDHCSSTQGRILSSPGTFRPWKVTVFEFLICQGGNPSTQIWCDQNRLTATNCPRSLRLSLSKNRFLLPWRPLPLRDSSDKRVPVAIHVVFHDPQKAASSFPVSLGSVKRWRHHWLPTTWTLSCLCDAPDDSFNINTYCLFLHLTHDFPFYCIEKQYCIILKPFFRKTSNGWCLSYSCDFLVFAWIFPCFFRFEHSA